MSPRMIARPRSMSCGVKGRSLICTPTNCDFSSFDSASMSEMIASTMAGVMPGSEGMSTPRASWKSCTAVGSPASISALGFGM